MRKIICVLPALFAVMSLSAQTGSLDPTFGTGGTVLTNIGVAAQGLGLAVQTDGKPIVVGYSNSTGVTDSNDVTIVRYTTAGIPDPAFGTAGIVIINLGGNDHANAVTVLSGGKILVGAFGGATSNDFAIIRLNSNGTLDGTFGTGGMAKFDIATNSDDQVFSMAIQSDGKILVAGTASTSQVDFVLLQLNADGTPDGGFGSGGIVITDIGSGSDDYAVPVLLQNDGKIIVAGTTNANGTFDFAMVRYNSDGSLDGGFGTGGKVITDVVTGNLDVAWNGALQSDGKIVLAGQTGTNPDYRIGGDFALVRYNSDGSLDGSFGAGGIVTTAVGTNTRDVAYSVLVQGDGKILAAGISDAPGNGGDYEVIRYSSTGILDVGFGVGGESNADIDGATQSDNGRSVQLSGNGRIYVAGFTTDLGTDRFSIAAFVNDLTLPLNLVQFTAQKQGSNIVLNWKTEQEQGVQTFDIQRCGDARSFSAVGEVAAAGGATTKSYSFTDHQPLSDINYYRLNIKDIDGRTKLSKIVAIKYNAATGKLEIFPNPVKSILQLQIPGGMHGRIDVQVTDASGKVVKTSVLESDGNSIATSLDVSSLTRGIYIVRAQAGTTSYTTQLLKN